MSMSTRIEDYDYHLPQELIAQHPLPHRDASRLMVLDRRRQTRTLTTFDQVGRWLDEHDVLVVNNSRVFPARLRGQKITGGRVELLLHHLPRPENHDPQVARAAAGYRGRHLQVGQRLFFEPPLEAEIIALLGEGMAEVRFSCAGADVCQAVLSRGEVPLPPYIRRASEVRDRESYQTIFATQTGAIACPTAGLHFTGAVLADLRRRGVDLVPITLHVGPGTFLPVRQADYTRHRMHAEYFEVSADAAARLNQAGSRGKRLVAVGTTSARVLEACAGPDGFTPQQGWCDLFIYPGYRFRAVDRLLTNFHLPRSTLLLLVSAFAGRELVLAAYQAAIQERCRFYSYGDGMLIL